jgi:long-chain acyl-CoA synthetase
MSLPQTSTPLERLYHFSKNSPEKTFLYQPLDRQWNEISWAETEDRVRKLAAALNAQGFEKGSKIAILSKNCADWIISDLAIWLAGYVSVPLYPTFNAETIEYILKHSECKLLLAGKLDQWESAKKGVPENLPVVCFDNWPLESATTMEKFCSLPAYQGNPVPNLDEMATIIYTSGTSGTPKGVVHNFSQISFVGTQIVDILSFNPRDRFFSYLPLSHVAERLLVELGCLYCGGSIYFAESLETFSKDINHAKPTQFLGVPRIWAKFQEGIYKNLPPKKLELLLKIPILSGIIKKKILTGLGLDQAKSVFSGAAHMAPSLFEFYDSLGLEIKEAYAMTENFAYSHLTFHERKPHFVGKALPYTDVKLGDNEEIMVKSPATMVCYYKEPEKTAETMEGEYLKTGDCGFIDNDQYLKITGRAKDLFKTAKGKYITPAPIEMKLEKSSLVEQSCVTGTTLSAPVALICLSELAKSLDKNELEAELAKHLSEVNGQIDGWEKMSALIVVSESWSVENNLLTPTMKMKRNKVEEKYGPRLESWAELRVKIIFE